MLPPSISIKIRGGLLFLALGPHWKHKSSFLSIKSTTLIELFQLTFGIKIFAVHFLKRRILRGILMFYQPKKIRRPHLNGGFNEGI